MNIVINYWAVAACMVSSVIIGFAWYGPLFGKPWMKLSGISMPDKKPSFFVMLKPIVISLLGALLMSLILGHWLVFSAVVLGVTGIEGGLQGAFWLWLGLTVPVSVSVVAWEGKPWKLFLIHSGYWLALLSVMSLILSRWG
jgi:hypothetical protein